MSAPGSPFSSPTQGRRSTFAASPRSSIDEPPARGPSLSFSVQPAPATPSSSSPLRDPDIVKEGFLKKKGRAAYKQDKTRWFALKGGGWLEYYKAEPGDRKVKPVGVVDLAGADVVMTNDNLCAFKLTAQLKPYFFIAENDKDAKEWLECIRAGISTANEGRESVAVQAFRSMAMASRSHGSGQTAGATFQDGNVIWSPQIFALKNKLGSGAYGAVYRAKMVDTVFECAIKVMDPGKDKQAIEAEYEALRSCSHPNIVQYYGCCLKTPKELWILMEYCDGGSVSDVMETLGTGYRDKELAYIAACVLRGLEYLHEETHVIHRDVKAANILFTKTGGIKIADFGIAHQFCDEYACTVTQLGTPHWMAPEVWKEEEYSTAADIWSFGITIYEMIMQQPPYTELGPWSVFHRVVKGPPPTLPEEMNAIYPDRVRKMLSACLTMDPNQRPTARQLLKHPMVVFVDFKDNKLVVNLLEKYVRKKKRKEQAKQRKEKHQKAISVKNADQATRDTIRERHASRQFDPNTHNTNYEDVISATMVVHETMVVNDVDDRSATPDFLRGPLDSDCSDVDTDSPRSRSESRSGLE